MEILGEDSCLSRRGILCDYQVPSNRNSLVLCEILSSAKLSAANNWRYGPAGKGGGVVVDSRCAKEIE